jgi:hypothetical protein
VAIACISRGVAISRKGVQNKNCVGALWVDLSPTLIGESCSFEPAAGFKIEIENLGELAVSDWVSHEPGACGGWPSY